MRIVSSHPILGEEARTLGHSDPNYASALVVRRPTMQRGFRNECVGRLETTIGTGHGDGAVVQVSPEDGETNLQQDTKYAFLLRNKRPQASSFGTLREEFCGAITSS